MIEIAWFEVFAGQGVPLVDSHTARGFYSAAGLAAEAPRDGVGDDAEALAKLVDEAEGEVAVDDRGADEEEARRRRALVVLVEERRAVGAAAALLLVALVAHLAVIVAVAVVAFALGVVVLLVVVVANGRVAPGEEVLGDAELDAALEARAEQGRLRRAQLDLAARGGGLRGGLGGGRRPDGLAVVAALVLDGVAPARADGEAAAGRGLDGEDAERREELRRRRGRAGRADALRRVGRELARRVLRRHVPVGRRRDDGAPLAAERQVRRRVHAALVAADDDEVVPLELLPRPHARVVAAELGAREEGLRGRAGVLELARGPDDVAALDHSRDAAGRGHHGDVEAAVAGRDGRDLRARANVELVRLREGLEVARVLLARRVLRVERERGRRAVGDGVEVEGLGPALAVERRRDEAHLLGPAAEGLAHGAAALDEEHAARVEAKDAREHERDADARGARADDDDVVGLGVVRRRLGRVLLRQLGDDALEPRDLFLRVLVLGHKAQGQLEHDPRLAERALARVRLALVLELRKERREQRAAPDEGRVRQDRKAGSEEHVVRGGRRLLEFPLLQQRFGFLEARLGGVFHELRHGGNGLISWRLANLLSEVLG